MPRHFNQNLMGEYAPASYAVRSSESKGRRYPEKPHKYRPAFQRDRERILHSAAFRRLEYKTQVFICHEGDYFRTRLTHTLEVAQIGRAIGFALGLNTDMIEALALAHDIGHTPFGHKGEDILDEQMKDSGGFEHNIHALRIVDLLEERYVGRPGLNLSWEIREGIIKHSKLYPQKKEYHEEFGDCPPYLEAQVVEIADEIAYDSHDLDDAIRSGLIGISEISEVPLCLRFISDIRKRHPDIDDEMLRHYLVREIINYLVDSIITSLQRAILESKIERPEDVRHFPGRLAQLPGPVREERQPLREFLMQKVYCNKKIVDIADEYTEKLKAIFIAYCENPGLMPGHFYRRVEEGQPIKRVVCDYVAGMTDRYALNEYKRIFK